MAQITKMSNNPGNTTLDSSRPPSLDSSRPPSVTIFPESRERYIEKFDFPYCAPIDKYEKIAKIGQGTFGEVFKARCKTEKTKIVALKKVLMENEKEGFPITALREIRILQLLNHANIVNLIEICRQYSRHKTTFYLVFDFAEHDLAGLLSNINVKFSLGEIKKVMQQMIEGLFLHPQQQNYSQIHEPRGDAVVPAAGVAAGGEELRHGRGHVGRGMYHGRDVDEVTYHAGKYRAASTDPDRSAVWVLHQ